MRIEKAITALRTELGLSRREFAERLGVTVTTISRYENGRQPKRDLLKRLASLADEGERHHLRDFFEARWKAEVVANVDKLQSAGTQRRVSVDDLKYWSAYLKSTTDMIEKVGIPDPEALREHLRHAAFIMSHVREKIEVYIDQPYSGTRVQEDEAILRSRWRRDQSGPASKDQPDRRSVQSSVFL